MNGDLIKYITEDRKHSINTILENWCTKCGRFKNFVYLYRDKIRSKIHNAKTEEDKKDIKSELEVAYLILLDDRFEVEYEKYRTGRTRAPDFSVIFEQATGFNVEVKRIREASLGDRYNKWIKYIVSRIRMVPSSLAFSLDIDTFDATDSFMNRLDSSKEEIANYIENAIRVDEDKLPFDTQIEYPVPGFGGEINLILSKPSQKTHANRTSYCGGIEPIFYTQKELRKFADAIFDKVGQMLPGMINVLVVISDSTTHEPEDVFESIRSINLLLRKGDEDFFLRKGFQGMRDFVSEAKHLSGVLFRNMWINDLHDRNTLWCNDQAEKQIPEIIKEYLKRMDSAK